MRTLTTAQTNILSAANRSTRYKVEVYRAAAWVDLSSFYTLNWNVSVSIQDNIDSPCVTASIVVWRNFFYGSMSPLMTNSLLNVGGTLLYPGTLVRVYAAVIPMDAPVQSSDYQLMFRGYIDQVSVGNDKVTCECRDEGGLLQDTFIEAEYVRGSDGGTQSETVMQNILDTSVSPAVTLYSTNGVVGFLGADSPGWAITTYRQQRMPVLEALRTIAHQIGWDVRYKWQTAAAGGADFRLVFFEPDRSASVAAWTFGADDYREISEVRINRDNVRNYIVCRYYDSAGVRRFSSSTDATSITTYGRRYFEMAEEESSQISSSTEADLMTSNALADLKDPIAEMDVTTPLFWPIELGDYYAFTDNGAHFDTTQNLAVAGYRHDLTKDKCGTTITVRGKPCGGHRLWLNKEMSRVSKQFGTNNLNATTDRGSNRLYNGDFAHVSAD